MATLIAVLGIVTMQAAAPAPASAPAPAGWSAAAKTMSTLGMDGKCAEVMAIAEQWVAKHPDFAEAHLRLGSAHENIARGFCGGGRPAPGPARTKQFETAAMHFRRAFELGGGETPWITIRALVDIYGFLALNRPDEQEKIAREAVSRYPKEPVAHVELIMSLLKRGADADAAKAVAAARASLPKAAEPRFDFASKMAFGAEALDPVLKLTLTREARMTMGRVAREMFDEVLAINPGHRYAQQKKAELEQTLADLPNERPLSSSNLPADELTLRSTLRAIASAQASYSAVCGGGFYAPSFAALARPRPGEKFGFLPSTDVPPDGGNVLETNRYAIEMTAPASPNSPAGCNGVSAGQAAQTWSATARPLPGYSGKSYRIDATERLTQIK